MDHKIVAWRKKSDPGTVAASVFAEPAFSSGQLNRADFEPLQLARPYMPDDEVRLRQEIAQMTPEQWRAWHEMEDAAAFVGSGAAFRSDVFVLLGSIFAMYKTRGTEPHQMLSPEMMALIDRLLA